MEKTMIFTSFFEEFCSLKTFYTRYFFCQLTLVFR